MNKCSQGRGPSPLYSAPADRTNCAKPLPASSESPAAAAWRNQPGRTQPEESQPLMSDFPSPSRSRTTSKDHEPYTVLDAADN